MGLTSHFYNHDLMLYPNVNDLILYGKFGLVGIH